MWASKQKAKTVAQTYSYLQEHKLMDYTELEKKAAEATNRYNDLQTKIKSAEQRKTAIAVAFMLTKITITMTEIYHFTKKYEYF